MRVAAPAGAQGCFQALAAGLLVAGAITAWAGARPTRPALLGTGVGALLLVLVGGPLGATSVGGLALLAIGMGLLALGGGALARQVGVPWAGAGGLGLLAVVGASTALLWADAAADRQPADTRGVTRLEVLAHDPLVALAYGVAGHDRLHEGEIYGRVPLAASTVTLPTPRDAALRLGRLGAAALGVAALLFLARRRRP
ncbi:MAG: hypothetical protein AB7T63_01280 [Planctomycetota bacterium]